jgi:hypothetical protein
VSVDQVPRPELPKATTMGDPASTWGIIVSWRHTCTYKGGVGGDARLAVTGHVQHRNRDVGRGKEGVATTDGPHAPSTPCQR